jgi:small-conductance mechanosensitive channel
MATSASTTDAAASHDVHSLLKEALAGLQNVSILWQAGVLAACLLIAWQLSRLLHLRLMTAGTPVNADQTMRIGMGGLNRLVFPVSAVLLVYVARGALRHFYPTTALLNVAVPLLFSLALVRIIVYLLRHAFNPGGPLRYWERFIAWIIWIGLALHITGVLPEIERLLDDLGFSVAGHRISALELLSGALSVAVTVLIALWAGRAIEVRLMAARGLDPGTRAVLSRLAKTVLVVLAVLIALPLVGIDLTVLSVFGGALGVGIGFGLQKIAANYISGFIILLDRSIAPGALVTIDNRHGEITRITARYLVVKGLDGTEAIIPNETAVSSTVINHSYSDPRVRVDVPIQVSYESDVELAMQLMREAGKANPRVLEQPAPAVVLKQFGESGVDLEMYLWISDPEAGRANLRSEIYLAIFRAFKAHRIDIPFPQRDVRIVRAPRPAPGGAPASGI